jgi:putative FmdB family regulatory protein
MPLYEFDCDACHARFEELVPAGGQAPCPHCGSQRVTRLFAPIASARLPVGLTGAAARDSDARRKEREARKRERFSAERKRRRGAGPPGG